MRSSLIAAFVVLCALPVGGCRRSSNASGVAESVFDKSRYEDVTLTTDQEIGRRVWYEACGDNGRFHTYVTPARIGAAENWNKVLGTNTRDERWHTYGMIQDPDCRPGDDSSYGFDICAGDRDDDGGVAPKGQGYQGLLSFVGKPGYKDPGCWISGTYNEADCPLGLGTSTGSLGYRKFPNPRFRAENWQGWEKFNPYDGSVEPPFLIGTSCGSCHIAFAPTDPPADPKHPAKHNIRGLVGNQFEHMAEIIASGADPHSLEWQGFTNGRAGSVDTSAHPTDLINNPNTVNAIINLARRPPGLPNFPGEDYKSFDKTIAHEDGSLYTARVSNILKGGEDDVGGAGAILRVYINEGLCSEPCWMNNLLDFRSFTGRGSAQTPFRAAQCRRDCPAYRSIENRYGNVIKFFTSPAGKQTDLKDAMFPADPPAVRYDKLTASLGKDKVNLGRRVYAKDCAICHSSQKPAPGQKPEDFFAAQARIAEQTGVDSFVVEKDGMRQDWLGSEERESVMKIGTNRCRSLHSNHLFGHIWDEFSSESYKRSPTPLGVPELRGLEGGGRGYYRDVSLLSVWVQAPFMHNNAVGPELCNIPHNRMTNCVDKDHIVLSDGRQVGLYTVEGRLKMFDDSMAQMLNPSTRGHKVTVLDDDLIIPIGFQSGINLSAQFPSVPLLSSLGLLSGIMSDLDVVSNALQGLRVVIPKGTPMALIGSLDYRKLVNGLAGQIASTDPSQRPQLLVNLLNATFADPAKLQALLASGAPGGNPNVYSGYANCVDVIEDKGHEFGSELSAQEKDALTAFMKTL